MPASSALSKSSEVEREISFLDNAVPRAPADTRELSFPRERSAVKRTIKALEQRTYATRADILSKQHALRETLGLIEKKWDRADVARYRGSFVIFLKGAEAAIAANIETLEAHRSNAFGFDESKTATHPDLRRFLRTHVRAGLDSIDSVLSAERRFLQFLQSEFLPRLDRRLRSLSEEMSIEESAVDIAARYPKVLEYLAR